MATYETGTATDTSDLITKLITFATANGWTVNSPTSGRVFTKGGIYFGLNWDVDDVFLAGATGYNAGAAWNAQPGVSAHRPTSNDMAGPFTAYHFFTGTAPDYLHVVVEKTPGVYKHFMFGQLVKHGVYTGGEYVGTVFWNMSNLGTLITPNFPDNANHATPFDSYAGNVADANVGCVRADIDAKSNNWMKFKSANTWTGNSARGVLRGKNTNGGSLYESLHGRSPSEFNQITPLLPILVAVDRPSNLTSPIGYAPDLRYVNMTNLEPGQLLTIAGAEWLCFPLIQKTTAFNVASSMTPSSGTYGLAYRRN